MKDEINQTTQTEERMHDLYKKIVSAITPEEKKALRIRLKALEKKHNSSMEEEINGKTYPKRLYYSDDKPMNVSEIMKLIDSVKTYPSDEFTSIGDVELNDLSGGSPRKGETRFVYRE